MIAEEDASPEVILGALPTGPAMAAHRAHGMWRRAGCPVEAARPVAEETPKRAPGTCWACRWAKNFVGCAHPRLSVEGPGPIAEWMDNGNISSETYMPIPTATPCPGFAAKDVS
jgi:hypothetical protein